MKKPEMQPTEVDQAVPLIKQLEHFAQVIQGKAEPVVDAASARETLAVILKSNAPLRHLRSDYNGDQMTQAPATLIQSQARTGIVLMIAAWGTFSVIDTSAKRDGGDPAVQVAFMRYAVQFLFTVIEGSRDGMTVIKSLNRTTLASLTLRGALLVVSTF